MKKNQGRDISGILLLNKPLHLSSNEALQRVKHIFYAKKAGHTGSLDPLATGMLPICFGKATQCSTLLLDSDKSYQVTMQLGLRSSTCDREGEIIESKDSSTINETHINKVIPQFIGEQNQIPSMFSAIKHQGTPLYKLARMGINIERTPRKISIHELKLTAFNDETKVASLFVKCTKGTYIRNLVDDMGQVLGCGALVDSLHRKSVAQFLEAHMIDLAYLESLRDEKAFKALDDLIIPLDSELLKENK